MAKNALKITDHGTFQMQLVEVGGELDDDGMTVATFRCKPEQARAMAPMMYAWIEAQCTSADIVEPER